MKTRRDLEVLGEDRYGDPLRPSPHRIELVTYPEAVKLTTEFVAGGKAAE
jgi:hypothetical protein